MKILWVINIFACCVSVQSFFFRIKHFALKYVFHTKLFLNWNSNKFLCFQKLNLLISFSCHPAIDKKRKTRFYFLPCIYCGKFSKREWFIARITIFASCLALKFMDRFPFECVNFNLASRKKCHTETPLACLIKRFCIFIFKARREIEKQTQIINEVIMRRNVQIFRKLLF